VEILLKSDKSYILDIIHNLESRQAPIWVAGRDIRGKPGDQVPLTSNEIFGIANTEKINSR
jgi:hypothetical protein